MKNRILLFVFAIASSVVYAQPQTETPSTFVQVMPTYPGGEQALYKFLYNNISYPEREKSMNIEGTVFVNFVIEKDGTPTNFTITRGVEGGIGLDREALNACMKLGKFNPGTQNGVPQRVFLTIPIKFHLEDGGESGLSKKEMKEIEKDAKYICDMMFKIVDAQRSGDEKKSKKLVDEFEKHAGTLQDRYAKGSDKEKELEKLVKPCLEEAMKDALRK
jgi:TonB family protein